MTLHHSRLEDFLDDPNFIRWVKRPDDELQAFWQTWLVAHPDKKELLEEARHLVLMLHFETPAPVQTEKEEVKKRLWQQLGLEEEETRKTVPFVAENHVKQPNWYYRIAAGVTGILLLGTVLFWLYRPEQTIRYQTHFGENRTLTLPEGSVVILNANSTLHYAPDWSPSQPREVWITGEAFFEIRKQVNPETGRRNSFTVHTPSADVQVLGTRFNVNNRRGKVRVVLNSGKVSLDMLHLEQPRIQMRPGDLVEISASNKQATFRKVIPENYTAWRHGKWVFDQTPLPEIAAMMEDYYGKRVVLAHKTLAHKKFTGAVPIGRLDVLLQVLAESFDLDITQAADQIRLEPRS